MAVGLLSGADEADEVREREGSIVRLKMKDFITYDSVECVPGNSLNVVIGPNGTGKSTILSAIVLGLGGKPSLLGKPNAGVQEFIKTNRSEALIEIELRGKKKNIIIKRKILSDGKSLWYINDRHVALKEVEAETKALNIQIDNLCQVLAQDRVQDFAKLNKQELLDATQKAVGKEGMAEIHSQLKDLQKTQKNLKDQIASEKHKLEIEEGHVDRLSGVVEKIERRRGIEEEVSKSQLKLSIVEYKLKKDEVDRFKSMKALADTKVRDIEAKLQPFQQSIAEAERKYNSLKNKHTGMEKKIRTQLNEVASSKSELERLRDEILESEVNLEKKLKLIKAQDGAEEKVRQAISKLKNDIANQNKLSSEKEEKSKKLNEEVAKLASLLNRTVNRKLELEEEVRLLNSQLQNIRGQIQRVQNIKDQRMGLLQNVHRHAYQAAQWIDQNRHLFEGQVFLPMIVELEVINPHYAKYVENIIGFNDMIAIMCESKNDMKTVVDNCRKKKGLTVNVLQIDKNVRPAVPNLDFNTLKRKCPQFDGYLSDFVRGPPEILNFLNHNKGFANIPVALENFDSSTVPAGITLYFTGEYRRSVQKSRFTSNSMYLSDCIGESRFFKTAGNDVDLDRLNQNAHDLNLLLDQKKPELASIQQELDGIEAQRNEKRGEQKKLSQIQANLENMKFHLGQRERELSNLGRRKTDPDKAKQDFSIAIKGVVVKLAEAQEKFFKALKQLHLSCTDRQLFELEVQAAKAAVNNCRRMCRSEEEARDEAEREVEQISDNLANKKTEAAKMVKAIETKHQGKKVQQLWNEYERLFSSLPNSVEELQNHIQEKMTHAEMLGGTNDAELIRQYETHVRQLEALKASIIDKEARASNLIETMQNRENEWKAELNQLVSTISSNFSQYFRKMKCAGTVELYTGNNEHDYDNYGLRIRVKYREEEELQDLNAHTQSGGERAVATAIYMLALQELTPAPFRLVDEINQGMDATNERRVYELLLESTSRPGTPQYFLLTPKLLKDMRYNNNTTVLCVMNSACAPNHKTWDIQKFISLRQQLRSNRRVEDSD